MTRIVFIAILLISAGLAQADVLILDEVRQVDRMELPRNGQDMAAVENHFGAPEQRHTAVGEPPITRWDYEDYSVYFEHDLVLFTVLREGAVIEKG